MEKFCKNCSEQIKTRAKKFCSYNCYWFWMNGKSHGHKTNNGNIAWNKNKRLPEQQGSNHFAWKGEKGSYRNLHRWVERFIGKPNKCTNCFVIGYGHRMHWANKSRDYKRELTDWVRLCPKCHKAYDRNELVLL